MNSTALAPPPASDADLRDVLRKALDRSEEPLSSNEVARQLTGPFRRSAENLQPILDEMAERGEIHKLPKYGGRYRYWTRDLETYARKTILNTLSQKPLIRSELKQKVKNKLRGISEKRQQTLLKELIQTGRVRELPPLIGARSKRLSTREADPRDYVENAVDKICRQLAEVDISRESVLKAAWELYGKRRPEPPVHLEKVILDRMSDIEPRAAQGAMVSIVELRRALDFQHHSKSEFDQAVWNLVRQGKVDVHRHDFPAGLSQDEREAMLADDQGYLYNGVSRRVY